MLFDKTRCCVVFAVAAVVAIFLSSPCFYDDVEAYVLWWIFFAFVFVVFFSQIHYTSYCFCACTCAYIFPAIQTWIMHDAKHKI